MHQPVRRNVDPEVAHLRARIAWLRPAGRHAEADEAARDLRARRLLLTTRTTVAETPLPLRQDQVDAIIAELRGATA